MIFDMKGSNEIGGEFRGNAVEFFLNNDFDLAIWQSVGKMEPFIEGLDIWRLVLLGYLFHVSKISQNVY